MYLYLLILLRIIDRDYEQFIRVVVIPVLVNSLWRFLWITRDLVSRTRPSCKKCHGRMSSFSLDKHLFCFKCRGSDCNLVYRCDECMKWTKEEMESYVKLRRSLSSKGKQSKSSPPWSIPHDSDIDISIATHSINKSVDQKIDAMSANLLAKFSSMLDKLQPRLNSPSFPDPSTVLGYSACLSEPPSRRPTDRIKCPAGLRFRKGGEEPVPHEDEIASARVIDETPETPHHPPGDAGEPQGRRSAPAFVRHHQAGAVFDFQPEDDDDDDDRESNADNAPSDRAYNRLMHYIHDRFPYLEPASAPQAPPRCEFEEFFSTSEAASSGKPNLTLYPRVDEILDSYADKAARFAKESKPLHRVLPLKCRTFHVGDRPDFCSARYLNPDFSRISKSKNILRSLASSVSLADLEKLDRASRSLVAGQSQSFWLLSSLLAQLRDEGFKPADPGLFDKNISTLSASLASQTGLSTGILEFVTSKRRESFLAYMSCPIAESVKRDLLVAPGTDSILFNQPLLEKVVSTMKEDSLISSTASLASISKAASRGRSGASGSGRYSSPLDFSRPGTSGYRKRSASPPCGSYKRARRGRGRTPSFNRGMGFRR